jgi:RHS repeat-associated protein
MTGSSGTEVNSYDSDPYGQTINQVEQTGLNNPWKFAGGYLDSSTTLYKFGTRYYDFSLGRWTQQDPVGGSLGDLNSANRYVYTDDDPVNLVDPGGKFSTTANLLACIISIVLGTVVAIIGLLQTTWAIGVLSSPGPPHAGCFVCCLYWSASTRRLDTCVVIVFFRRKAYG